MTKHDWLILFIRATGLYMIGVHFATFVTATSSLIVLLEQKPAPTMTPFMWQGPVASGLVLATGLFFLFGARVVAAMVEGEKD